MAAGLPALSPVALVEEAGDGVSSYLIVLMAPAAPSTLLMAAASVGTTNYLCNNISPDRVGYYVAKLVIFITAERSPCRGAWVLLALHRQGTARDRAGPSRIRVEAVSPPKSLDNPVCSVDYRSCHGLGLELGVTAVGV